MNNSDFTEKWENGPGVPGGWASSVFFLTPAEFIIKSHVQGRRKRIENSGTLNKSVFMVQIEKPNSPRAIYGNIKYHLMNLSNSYS